MAELTRREPMVPGYRNVVVEGIIRARVLSAANKRWQSWLLTKAKAEAEAPPTWAQALEDDMLSQSLKDRISDLGSLIWVLDRAARRKKVPDFSRVFDEYPHRERLLLDSLNLFQAGQSLDSLKPFQEQQSLNVQAGLKEEATEMTELLQPILADPVQAEQFKQFLKSEKLALFHESSRVASQKKDLDFSGMSEADRAAAADMLRQLVLEEASRCCPEEGDPVRRQLEARSRIMDFDPKQGGDYYNSYCFHDLSTFDLGEESPIGPMRFTKKVFKDNKAEVCLAVNILSVQVACSDVGFPIQVYGTVIARDSTDFKRIYLFHRDRDHCQLINSEDKALILTGPKRGLAMLDCNYIETDLKIRDHQGQDREFSKGLLIIRGMIGCPLKECYVERRSISTRLSTVKIVYAVVVSAVEATIAIEGVEGEFCGTVTAHTTSIKKRLLLYDSQVAGHKHAGLGPVKMMRPVICVSVKDKLIITAKDLGGCTCTYAVFTVTPKFSGGHRGEFSLGTAKMCLQVVWSIMDP